jgi:hypothetical protein
MRTPSALAFELNSAHGPAPTIPRCRNQSARLTLDTHGIPAATLTDNGMVFTARFAGGKGGRSYQPGAPNGPTWKKPRTRPEFRAIPMSCDTTWQREQW